MVMNLMKRTFLRRRTTTRRTTTTTTTTTRSFFGLSELMGILANPRETVTSLADSKRLLEQTRAEILEKKERQSIPPKHTFSPLPGLQHRQQELKVLKTCFSSLPNFTIIFGGTSVGKTALLRQVLADQRYHVIHFDLRMAGFADVGSLFFSFSYQMEQYFVDLANRLEGYDSFQKEALAFKHLRLDIERRLEKNGPPIKTSDVAHLLEIFQSCLLKYWEFVPVNPEDLEAEKEKITNKPVNEWKKSKLKGTDRNTELPDNHPPPSIPGVGEGEAKVKGMEASRAVQVEEDAEKTAQSPQSEHDKKWKPPVKLIPVFFLDEAHKLPVLIKDPEAMKCILDGLLVLTKQDRLCHVINATSDPFYMNWLRSMNVLTHATIITIGDPSREEARQYFDTNLKDAFRATSEHQPSSATSNVQDSGGSLEDPSSHDQLDFESIYETFGGKLAHLQTFVGDYLTSGRKLTPKQSSPFLQAYALLHHYLIHAHEQQEQAGESGRRRRIGKRTGGRVSRAASPGRAGQRAGMVAAAQEERVAFTAGDMLYVLSKFTRYEVDRAGAIVMGSAGPPRPRPSDPRPAVSYFTLCRELGARAVNGLVSARILDLRWTPPVSSDLPPPAPLVATLQPVLVPISPVMKSAIQTLLDEHAHQSLL